jgi:hypothetical protein
MPELALIANFSSSTAIILQPIKPTAKKGFNKQAVQGQISVQEKVFWFLRLKVDNYMSWLRL